MTARRDWHRWRIKTDGPEPGSPGIEIRNCGVVDEVRVGGWLHVEALDKRARTYDVHVGALHLSVRRLPTGRVVVVRVAGGFDELDVVVANPKRRKR